MRLKLRRYIMTHMDHDRFDWINDNFNLEYKLQRIICIFGGHAPERDHCNRPEHDYCFWCHKRTPNKAR